MKKKIMALFLALALGCGMSVQAEEFYGGEGWQVTFTADRKMESNFKRGDLDEAVSGLQPGDSILFTVNLKNENSVSTDWYMTNEVLYSLEDRSANSGTRGGAYTYELIYTDKSGRENVLFSSDTIGGDSAGEEGQGLHAATGALEEYFYLDSLGTGQGGTITLLIALDGETQGNDYQDTLADLQMNFAVELNNRSPVTVTEEEPPTYLPPTQEEIPLEDMPEDSTPTATTIVKTGDETDMVPYIVAMGISGALILALAIYSLKQSRKERKEAD